MNLEYYLKKYLISSIFIKTNNLINMELFFIILFIGCLIFCGGGILAFLLGILVWIFELFCSIFSFIFVLSFKILIIIFILMFFIFIIL